MPKFKYETHLELAGTLAAMGMPDSFASDRADFAGMTGRRGLFISRVVHNAFVAVDEMGTEAAAVTGVAIEPLSVPMDMRVDHPFLFVIRDTQTDTILFVGRVVDPTR